MKNKKIVAFLVMVSGLLLIGGGISFSMGNNVYEVTFNPNNGDDSTVISVSENSVVGKIEDPIKEGYKFLEWQLNGEAYNFSNKVTKNITLNAVWQTIIDSDGTRLYIASFDTNGGNKIENQTVKEGYTVNMPDNPTREGYTFVKWQLDGTDYDFSSIVTSDIVLSAVWEKQDVKYVITFDSNGGSSVNPIEVLNDNSYSKPQNPTREGYTFVEWQLDGKTYNFNETLTKNITLKAVWKANDTTPTETPINEYTVTFNSNGGSVVNSQTVRENSLVVKPQNPTRDGYTFVEWQSNGATYDFSKPVTKNFTLKAVWKVNDTTPTETPINEYTVTFDSNGGSNVSNQIINSGNTVSKPQNPTKSGYNFIEWQLNGVTYDFSSPVNSDITLVAKWNQKSYTFSLSLVDAFSLDRYLNIYEDGVKINVKEIKYNDGTFLAKPSNSNGNITVNPNDITGESTLLVVLLDGTNVTATINNK